MNTNINIKNKTTSNNTSINKTTWLSRNYDYFIIFGGFAVIFIVCIVLTVGYEHATSIRHNVLFNNVIAMVAGVLFIYVVFSFVGNRITIFGISLDMGMLLFIACGIIIVFVIGD